MKGGAPAALAVHPGVPTGIALAAGGYALFALQDAAVKWLVGTYPVAEILCLRSAVIVGLALLSGAAPARRPRRCSRAATSRPSRRGPR